MTSPRPSAPPSTRPDRTSARAAAGAAAVAVPGPRGGAVRIDSGDLAELAALVRAELDGLGARATRVIVTGDLAEPPLAAPRAPPGTAPSAPPSSAPGSRGSARGRRG